MQFVDYLDMDYLLEESQSTQQQKPIPTIKVLVHIPPPKV